MSRHFVCGLAIWAAFLSADAASPPPVAARNGMVVTAQQLATRAGLDVLQRGGNAIDAAVAVGYALAVSYPAAGSLGGGGFMTIRLADGRTTFIDFREKAPLASTADMYLDSRGNERKGASRDGHLAAAVPGTVAGLEYARARYGTMQGAQLLAPAIELAEKGFALDRGDVELFRLAGEDLLGDPASREIFSNRGARFDVGDILVQKDLAATLREIARRGPDGFYKGRVGAALVAANRAGGGIFTQADLDAYKPREFAPVECDYRGFHVITAAPPSSGGIVVCEVLNVLEGYPLRELGFHSAQAVHYQIEAMRHAYADRNGSLGDPDFVANPTARLLDKKYAASIRAGIAPDRAGVSLDIRHAAPAHEGMNTTHYSVVDKDGNVVSVTHTLNEFFGARVTAAGTGVILNDEMDDFTVKAGAPNLYGLVQGGQNRIAPGKRPLSSMAPTIVTKDGAPVMVLGTAGGSRIPTTVLLTIVNAIDYGMNIQEAVDAPRFHQQWLPETTAIERFALSPDTRSILERMGHRFTSATLARHVAAVMIGGPSLGARADGRDRYFGAHDSGQHTGSALGY